MGIRPICDDVSRIETFSGRYGVQLEILPESTLSERDIRRILEISSWEVDPNKAAEGFEGRRAVLVSREHPIEKGGIKLSGLQISGIGCLGVSDVEGARAIYTVSSDAVFEPPNADNYMDEVDPTLMTTSYAENGKVKTARQGYAPIGTYAFRNLKRKVKKTRSISKMSFDSMAVPHVEAYGRYLDDRLQNGDGPFGFVVFPIPGVDTGRIAEEAVKDVNKILGNGRSNIAEASLAVYYSVAPAIASFVNSLRELHSSARLVHSSTHLSNANCVDGKPYVMDWSEFRRLGKNRRDNILSRVIDISKPADNYQSLMDAYFKGAVNSEAAGALMRTLVWEVYSGNPNQEIDGSAVAEIVERTEKKLGKEPNDIEINAQFLKDLGLEGYPRHVYDFQKE